MRIAEKVFFILFKLKHEILKSLKFCYSSERKPQWIAYCSTALRDRVFLSADNGMLYVFDGNYSVINDTRRYNSSTLSARVEGFCPLMCVVEIPVKV